ncbi:MAG: AlpA family phage regulatory protein [Mesorhizobium sp.]|uniref:helix-turn-helix transcriptional regulator n=1 Tax=Mesorhizobium sp. TaxID=1871066 RepID=UPI00120B28C0|nr:AlpA family phage regulatory protein [Mesorhizobium sp.]TIN02681.1 MAG: AlpA family phage regulatory protein [Mesorhizobium sp.]
MGSKTMQILSIKETCKRVGICRSTILQMMQDRKFPRTIQITPKRKGFIDSEINEWIKARIAERDA